MIKYHFSCPKPTSQFVKISLKIENKYASKIKLRLPAWRAGRYQIADYAKNIRNLEVIDESGVSIEKKKETKNTWSFTADSNVAYHVSYEYYAAKMDAGSSWLDEEQCYLNLVNCCFEVLGLHSEPKYLFEFECSNFPKKISTLSQNRLGEYVAENFQEIADATFLAAKKLIHWSYQAIDTTFHIWIHGEVHFDKKRFIENLKSFSERMIHDFGDFPESEYHFIYQLLPYKHYHGVEHQKGTVITFGPAESLKKSQEMEDLLGVSCHELYHAWNVCRIRPKELLPYNFAKEVYTKAGWILEGITTYLGDIYLLKSGVYSLKTYLKHLNGMVKRESIAQGTQSSSILESSFDLWLDGYEPGIPSKKTNIYSHGALIALSLDILLLEQGSSLPELMRTAWIRFGKPKKGYLQSSFWNILKSLVKDMEELNDFYVKYISGKNNILEFLDKKLHLIGLQSIPNPNQNQVYLFLGIQISKEKVTFVHAQSPAFKNVMIGDQIETTISESKIFLNLNRINGNNYQLEFKKSNSVKFPELLITGEAKTNLGIKWKE